VGLCQPRLRIFYRFDFLLTGKACCLFCFGQPLDQVKAMFQCILCNQWSFRLRHLLISSWWPERRMSGTWWPMKVDGLV
jgi:hypothetical protein